MQSHLGAIRQCKQSAGDDLRNLWILLKLEKDGTVKEVLLYPATKVGDLRPGSTSKSQVRPASPARLLDKRLYENVSLTCLTKHKPSLCSSSLLKLKPSSGQDDQPKP